jgi:integrase
LLLLRGVTDVPKHRRKPELFWMLCADCFVGPLMPDTFLQIQLLASKTLRPAAHKAFQFGLRKTLSDIGTKERVWLDVLLYTGLRRGDAVKFGRQHVRDGVATLRTEKSGGTVPVPIPILPILMKTLAAGPTGDLAYICGSNGKPLTKESFGNVFRAAARAAGVLKSAHGVRKSAATTAAENGATGHELDSVFGWTNGKTAAIYTRNANRTKLAKSGIGKLIRTRPEQSTPAPDATDARTSSNSK